MRNGKSVTHWTTGLTTWDPDRSYFGYTLFCPNASRTLYLLDINGEGVHLWFLSLSIASRTSTHAKHVGQGRILYSPGRGKVEAWPHDRESVQEPFRIWLAELDWNSHVVWSYRPPGPLPSKRIEDASSKSPPMARSFGNTSTDSWACSITST